MFGPKTAIFAPKKLFQALIDTYFIYLLKCDQIFRMAASSDANCEEFFEPCLKEEGLCTGWQKRSVRRRDNRSLWDVKFISPDFQFFSSLRAAQQYDNTYRQNWGHLVRDKERKSETFKNDVVIEREKLTIVTEYSKENLQGKRKFSIVCSVSDFAKTQFLNQYSEEEDRNEAFDILCYLQILLFIRKQKLRKVDRKWHSLASQIEKFSNFILHDECIA